MADDRTWSQAEAERIARENAETERRLANQREAARRRETR